MVSKVHSVGLTGLSSFMVEVEADIAGTDLDPLFQTFLAPGANIVQFQKLGHLLTCPGRDQTPEVIWRLWGLPGRERPFDELPARTALERGVVEHLKKGGRFEEGLLVIFRDELNF